MTNYQPDQPGSVPPGAPAPAPSPAASAPQYGYAPAVPKFNVLAIVGFILAFVVSIAGLIVSIIARNQIKKTGERGGSLALWGIILSIIFLVIGIVTAIISFVAAASLVNSGTTY